LADTMEACVSCSVQQSNVADCAERMERRRHTSECCQDMRRFALHTCATEKLQPHTYTVAKM